MNTKEPWQTCHMDGWRYADHSGIAEAHAVIDSDGNVVALTREESAKRIVACVNACAGYSTGLLSAFSLKTQLGYQQQIEKELERVKKENEQLKTELANEWHLDQSAIQEIRAATEEVYLDERNDLVLSVGWIKGEDGEPDEYGLRMSLYEYPDEGATMLAKMTPLDIK